MEVGTGLGFTCGRGKIRAMSLGKKTAVVLFLGVVLADRMEAGGVVVVEVMAAEELSKAKTTTVGVTRFIRMAMGMKIGTQTRDLMVSRT